MREKFAELHNKIRYRLDNLKPWGSPDFVNDNDCKTKYELSIRTNGRFHQRARFHTNDGGLRLWDAERAELLRALGGADLLAEAMAADPHARMSPEQLGGACVRGGVRGGGVPFRRTPRRSRAHLT